MSHFNPKKILSWKQKKFIKNLIRQTPGLKPKPWWTPESEKILTSNSALENIDYTEVYSKREANFPPPFVRGIDTKFNFMAEPIKFFDSIGMYEIRSATSYCSNGVVVTDKGNILSQTLWERDCPYDIKLPVPPHAFSTQNLSGISLSIATESSDGNYGHFLLDAIGRFAIVEKIVPEFREIIDNLIVSGEKKAWKVELLKKFGIREEKIVWANQKSAFNCQKLWVTSFPGARRTYPSWLSDFFQESSVGQQKSANSSRHKSRLFLIRKGTSRQLKNQDELQIIAQEYGFQSYIPEQSNDPISDFRNAEAVIAPHGAGLADIVFMLKGSNVLELMPSDHRHCYFYTLASSAKLKYEIIIGQSDGDRGESPLGPSPFDFQIDKTVFLQYLNDKFLIK